MNMGYTETMTPVLVRDDDVWHRTITEIHRRQLSNHKRVVVDPHIEVTLTNTVAGDVLEEAICPST